jgi:cell wall-associated NlpC family hydrolase
MSKEQYGFCALARIPMRKEPSSESEMVTEILFGEGLLVFEKQGEWYKVECFQPYEGWVNIKQITFINEQESLRLMNPTFFCADDCTLVSLTEPPLRILKGSPLPSFEKASHTSTINGKIWTVKGKVVEQKKDLVTLLQYAEGYLNAPYFWGGRSPYGIDCSGLMQILFRFVGIKLPRNVDWQVTKGVDVVCQEPQVGDLAFFKNKKGDLVHVGLVYAPGKVLHASGYVKISTLDQQGIINDDGVGYSHFFYKAIRVL